MIIYNNKQLSINYLIENKSSVSIYERNVQVKVTEICKVSNSFTPPHINYNSEVRNEYPYNLKQISQFFDSLIKSQKFFLFRAKSLEYTPKQLQKYRYPRQIQKSIKKGNLRIVLIEFVRDTLQILILYTKQCLNYLFVKY